jgi:ATP-dependent 26S proteasome regulatory subunit
LANGNHKANEIIETLIRARYPIIYVVSWEEERVEDVLRSIASTRGTKFYTWTVTHGIASEAQVKDEITKDPLGALDYINDYKAGAIFVLKDLHAFIGDKIVTRRLRDLSSSLKTSNKTLVILSPVLRIPSELEKEITVVDYPLPDIGELDRLLDGIIDSLKGNSQIRTNMAGDEREVIIKAAQGLTSGEAENVFAKSLVERHQLDLEVIISEKEQIIRKSGMLEYYPATEEFANVGGMNSLKSWLQMRSVAFTERAREFGLPQPKGVMLMGIQGCGKSLCCKSIASLWRMPLLRLDTGKIFSGLVGSSEENVRKAISIAESVAPCILWVDEIEKGFAGIQSSAYSDAGTTARVFGSFITWLQEKTAPVFVVATANDITQIPPEFMRKGRFDEIFFVDLPSDKERQEIFEIHLKKRKRNPVNYDLGMLSSRTDGFSGAEIEQVVIDALYTAFGADRELSQDDLMLCAKSSVPLSTTVSEKIAALRKWAAHRCRMASATPQKQ